MGNLLNQEWPVQAALVKGPHAVKASEAYPAQTQAL